MVMVVPSASSAYERPAPASAAERSSPVSPDAGRSRTAGWARKRVTAPSSWSPGVLPSKLTKMVADALSGLGRDALLAPPQAGTGADEAAWWRLAGAA